MMILFLLIWFIVGFFVFTQNTEYIVDMPGRTSFLVFLIFVIGGPFFVITQVVETLLNLFLPEGQEGREDCRTT